MRCEHSLRSEVRISSCGGSAPIGPLPSRPLGVARTRRSIGSPPGPPSCRGSAREQVLVVVARQREARTVAAPLPVVLGVMRDFVSPGGEGLRGRSALPTRTSTSRFRGACRPAMELGFVGVSFATMSPVLLSMTSRKSASNPSSEVLAAGRPAGRPYPIEPSDVRTSSALYDLEALLFGVAAVCARRLPIEAHDGELRTVRRHFASIT